MSELGSPPLVRERLSPKNCLNHNNGITPARAGKTNQGGLHGWGNGDHPRSCGKDMIIRIAVRRCGGSPPLVRERRLSCSIVVIMIGITPARAGKTSLLLHCCHHDWDHPRSCGKDLPIPFSPVWPSGSPPLVRERHYFTGFLESKKGITPARAGKTGPDTSRNYKSQDHPRSCGKDHVVRV